MITASADETATTATVAVILRAATARFDELADARTVTGGSTGRGRATTETETPLASSATRSDRTWGVTRSSSAATAGPATAVGADVGVGGVVGTDDSADAVWIVGDGAGGIVVGIAPVAPVRSVPAGLACS